MLPNRIRKLFARLFTNPSKTRPKVRFRPQLEPCDDRNLPSTVTIASLGDITEGGDPNIFRLTRDDTTNAVTVTIAFSGTATSGDYVPSRSTTVFFAPGQATADVTISPSTTPIQSLPKR